MHQEQFQILLEKYLTDKATVGERSMLFRRLDRRPFDKRWAELIDEYFADPAFEADADPALQEQVRTRLLEAIRRLPREEPLPQVTPLPQGTPEAQVTPLAQVSRLVPFRWIAAAAIFAVLAAGAWWFRYQHAVTGPAQPAVAIVHDIAPGHNGAILTLAGGQQLTLDSAANGTVATQGATAIVKSNGQLSYTNTTPQKIILYNTLSTPRGRQYQLVLPDGTKVWLDAASSLTFPTAFTGGRRKVVLTGQAYFEVAHRSNQPFSVEVNGTEVKDIGTAFNINAYEDEPTAKITLVEGVVAVTHHDRQVVLKPGQQARIDGAQLSVAAGVDVDEVLAWKNGQFQFDNAGIAEIMRQVARWYDVDVRYEGDVLQRHFSGGVPRTANASALLQVLELTKSVRFRMDGKQIIVQPYQ